MHELNAFQRDLLYPIAGLGNPSGREIHDELSLYYAEDIGSGRLYQALDRLVEEGYVERGKRNGRTNEYTLTAKGRRAMQNRHDWEEQYLPGPVTEGQGRGQETAGDRAEA